jgi:hypothetical protein
MDGTGGILQLAIQCIALLQVAYAAETLKITAFKLFGRQQGTLEFSVADLYCMIQLGRLASRDLADW